jgi:hypothetical protein
MIWIENSKVEPVECRYFSRLSFSTHCFEFEPASRRSLILLIPCDLSPEWMIQNISTQVQEWMMAARFVIKFTIELC